MNLNEMKSEELELMSYTDLSYALLKQNKKTMNTPTLFREICNLLEYTDDDFASKIGDYYTSLTIDKRFVLCENNEWDIRDHRSVQLIVDEDDEDDEIIEVEDEEEKDEEEDKLYDDENEIDDDNDDMDNLAIVDEDELDEE